MSEIYDLATASAFSKELAESAAIKYATQLHSLTWSTTEGLTGVLHTTNGCMAGMPLADVVYILAMAKVLNVIRDKLRAAGLVHHIVPPGVQSEYPVWDVSYVDDAMFPVFNPHKTLMQSTSEAMSIINCAFCSFRMIVNYAPGKTECMLMWYGRGSQVTARAMTATMTTVIPIKGIGNQIHYLRIVSEYKHMGTTLSLQANFNQEVRI